MTVRTGHRTGREGGDRQGSERRASGVVARLGRVLLHAPPVEVICHLLHESVSVSEHAVSEEAKSVAGGSKNTKIPS